MYRITLGLVLYLAVSAYATFQNCGSTVGHYNDVIFGDWDPFDQSSSSAHSQKFPLEINFDLDKDTRRVSAISHVIIDGTSHSLHVAPVNACYNAGLSCPLTKVGGPYKYKPNVSIPFIRGKTGNFTLKWELKDQNGDNIVCVLIPTKIV